MLNSANVATIFLDGKLRIRFFTPAVKSHFSIVATDVGRPLADLASHSNDKALLADAAAVLANLAPLSREIESDGGTSYLRRIMPYQARNDRAGGVVITFADISELKVAEREIEAARLLQQHRRDGPQTPGGSRWRSSDYLREPRLL